MKKINLFFQFAIGFFSIMFLWIVGASFGSDLAFDWISDNLDTEELIFSCIIPLVVVIAIPIVLLLFTVLCKRKSLKVMYVSALIATALPVISNILSSVFSNDGNILSWIYAFTVGLIFYPFGRISFEVFNGVNSFYFVYKDAFIEDSAIVTFFVVVMIASLILYRIIKPENKTVDSKK